MKKVNLIVILLFCSHFSVFSGSASQADVPKTEYLNVSSSVVMVKHAYGCNITCIKTEKGLLFVDCGMKTELAERFRKDMEKRFKKKTIALLVTHAHIDHFLGMGAFSDIRVVASETGKSLWQKQLAIEFNEKRIEAFTRIFPKFRDSIKTAKPFMPTEWFNEKKVIGSGKSQVSFINTGGHTSCSSSVFFPLEGVLVAGDLVQVDQYPYFGDPSTDMNSWIETFKKWETLPIKKICPGHGGVVDKGYLKKMRNYFETLIFTLKQLKKQNLPVKEVIRHKKLPKGYWGDQIKRPVWFDYCIASLYTKL